MAVHFLRGNVNTRLAKLDSNQYDAIVLASAGLIRLGMVSRIRSYFKTHLILPAVGQGAVGVELRIDDEVTKQLVAPLNHKPTAFRVGAERAMNKRLNGGCQVPIGGFAELEGDQLRLQGLVGSPDGKTIYRSEAMASAENYNALGLQVADALLAQGAKKILDELAHT